MSSSRAFAEAVLTTSVVGLGAVMSNRVASVLRVPAPALMLAAAAVLVKAVPSINRPPQHVVEQIVTLALLCILFDGGMNIGWSRFRAAAAPIGIVGVAGTFLTTAAAALVMHLVGLGWYAAVLVATAVAPTDPAVVFAVLGQREVKGRSGTVLEGESGANDPVGIALMASLIAAGELSTHAAGHVASTFALEMGVGVVVGVIGGKALEWFMRVALPGAALYSLRTLVVAMGLFGLTVVLHGSGFLAVFIAGIVVGDTRAPYKREIEHFHSALANMGEIVAFVVLGLTVDLSTLRHADVLWPGLLLGVALAVVIRPAIVGLCLAGSGLKNNEKAFVLFSGLKGAVPILLGTFILETDLPDADRLYGIVVIVVVFSVVAQGSFVPAVAKALKVPMRVLEPEPWSLGVRLRDEPDGVHRLTVRQGSAADGSTIEDLDQFPDGAWISFIVRRGQLVPVSGETRLEAADEALILGEPELGDALKRIFLEPRALGSSQHDEEV